MAETDTLVRPFLALLLRRDIEQALRWFVAPLFWHSDAVLDSGRPFHYKIQPLLFVDRILMTGLLPLLSLNSLMVSIFF